MKLLELFQIIDEALLLEARIDYLKDTFAEKLSQKSGMEPDAIFSQFVEADPSPQKKFTQWLIQTYLNGKLRLEDLYKANEYIQLFVANAKSLPVEQRNIAAYKSLQDLAAVVLPLKGKAPELSNREKDKALGMKMHSPEHSETVYNSPTMKVVIPKTEAASCYFGKNTEWCTAATSSNNMFSDYNSDGPLYIILIKKENIRFQFHFESKSFMDEHDDPINPENVLKQYPEIKNAFTETQLMDMIPVDVLYKRTGMNEYLENRVRHDFNKAEAPLGEYIEKEDSFVLAKYPSLFDVVRTWFKEGDNVWNILDGEMSDDVDIPNIEREEVDYFFDSIDGGTAIGLYDEMISKYENYVAPLSKQEKENLADFSDYYQTSDFINYFIHQLNFDKAEELWDMAVRAVGNGLTAGSRNSAHKAAKEHIDDLETSIDSEEIDANMLGLRMEQSGNDYLLTATSDGVIGMAYEIEEELRDNGDTFDITRWEYILYAADLEIPYNGWDDYDEDEATEYFNDEVSDYGWSFT